MSIGLIFTYGFLGFLAAVGFISLLILALQFLSPGLPSEDVCLIAVVTVSKDGGGRIADEIWRYRFFLDRQKARDGFLLLVGDALDEESLQCCRILSSSYPWIGFCTAEEFETVRSEMF